MASQISVTIYIVDLFVKKTLLYTTLHTLVGKEKVQALDSQHPSPVFLEDGKNVKFAFDGIFKFKQRTRCAYKG